MLKQKEETSASPANSGHDLFKEHEILIHNLLEGAPYPLLVINTDTSINYVNSALQELTGFSAQEIIGCKPPFPWWTGDIQSQTDELKNNMLRGEQKSEKLARKKSGEYFWIQVSAKPIFVNGELKFFLSNWVDITERKHAEEQLSRLNKELRDLSSHMDSIREEERGNISRMTHDELGQALIALKMDVCWLRKSLKDDQTPLIEVADSMIRLIDATFKKVRWISTVLRPRWLDDLGLSDSIKWLIEEFQEMTEIQCELSMSRNLNLDKQLSTAIYRIFQEALTNIFRHSKATRVQINLKKQENHITLSIVDNGIGISSKRMSKTKSFGILGMRERAQSLGGAFEITGVPNKGTSIKVSFPI